MSFPPPTPLSSRRRPHICVISIRRSSFSAGAIAARIMAWACFTLSSPRAFAGGCPLFHIGFKRSGCCSDCLTPAMLAAEELASLIIRASLKNFSK
ncbi:hypothetical protein DVH24_030229 [Malus domestica]|uniref:Uncharacterized protein n=1 Tax=Malus domestica TaxID=3750 RepID=A0A498HV87_MALDO|nr:hypothetical protein DVH24_030229 [Malus domestica]